MTQTNTAPNKSGGYAELVNKFETLAPREKAVIFVATPLLIMFVLTLLVLEPMYKEIQSAEKRMKAQQAQLVNLQNTGNELLVELKKDPDIQVKAQIAALQQQLLDIANSFDAELGQLVSPKAMPILLESLFDKAQGLTLLEMESIPPEPIYSGENAEKDAPLFRQGIRIRFQGDFFATQRFFADAETLSWKLYWKYLNYNVDAHPLATIELEVFTLSTSEAFIGVQ